MMATVPHVTFGLGLRKFQADGFLLTFHVWRHYSPSVPRVVKRCHLFSTFSDVPALALIYSWWLVVNWILASL